MQHMLYETDGPVAVLTLKRPEKANAVSGLTLNEMDECFTRAADDSDVSVFDIHQTGHGNALSVGGYPILTGLTDMKKSQQ